MDRLQEGALRVLVLSGKLRTLAEAHVTHLLQAVHKHCNCQVTPPRPASGTGAHACHTEVLLLFKGVAQTLQAHTLQAHRVQESLDGMANGRRRLSGLRPQDPAEQGPGVDTGANPTTHE